MRVQSLGRVDPLEEEMATHSIFFPGESHWQRSLCSPWCHRARHDWSDSAHTKQMRSSVFSVCDLYLSDCFLFLLYLSFFHCFLLIPLPWFYTTSSSSSSSLSITSRQSMEHLPYASPLPSLILTTAQWDRLSYPPLSQNHRCSDGWYQVLNLAVWFQSPEARSHSAIQYICKDVVCTISPGSVAWIINTVYSALSYNTF